MDDLYISKCRTYIDFMLSHNQWSGIERKDVDRWLSNFQDVPQERMEFVYRLLVNLLYFSESDVIDILRTGVFSCVAYRTITSAQIKNGFSMSSHHLTGLYDDEMAKTCFVPLLDSDAPHESGNYISRLLVQQGIIPRSSSLFIESVPELISRMEIKRMVILDDCVGSGQQLTSFWQNKTIIDDGQAVSINMFCKRHQIEVHYLTLFGYRASIDSIRQQFIDLQVTCTRYLSEQQRVFSDNSYVWKDINQRNEAIDFFKQITNDSAIPLLGYNCLDFALIMHQTIPDWSLPLFWKENPDWKLLLRRKNSND